MFIRLKLVKADGIAMKTEKAQYLALRDYCEFFSRKSYLTAVTVNTDEYSTQLVFLEPLQHCLIYRFSTQLLNSLP